MSHFEHVQEVALPADVLQEQAPGSTADGGVLSGPAETPSVQTVCTPDGVVTIEGRATGCPATQVSDTVQSENLLDLMVTSRSPADTAGLCEETLATPDAAPAAHRGDDGQDDDAAGADVQPEPTVPQGTTDGPAPHGVVAVAQLGDVAQDDDSEVDALEAAMERTAQRHREEDEDDEPPFFPLRVQFNPPTPFPADALPPLLAAWAMAVAVLVRGTFAVAAMMIVSAMGLILQAHGDIELWDQRRVLSYFSLIAAGT